MASHKKINNSSGKIKFRFIEFEIDGSDGTLQESLKSLAAAISRNPTSVNRLLKRDERPNEEDSTNEEINPTDEVEEIEVIEHPKRASQSARKPSTPRKVKVLTEFRLDDVTPTLKEFCVQKSPQSDYKKYLVIAFWFKEFKNITDITPDHVHTAYRAMNWATPKDPAQPFRDLKSKNGWLSNGETRGTYTINHIGENVVNDMKAGE